MGCNSKSEIRNSKFMKEGVMKVARAILTVVVLVTLLGAVGASAGIDDGLVAYWPLDGSAADATGNGYNGVLVGNVTFVPGVRGGAASFDGRDDRIRIVGKVPYQNEYTFSGWIRFDGPPQNDYNLVFVRGSSCNDASQDLGTYYSAKTITVTVCDFSYPWYLRAPFDLVNGRWYHLAATVRPGEVRIYLDGVMVAEQALTGVIDTDTCYVEHAIGGMSSTSLGGPWAHNGLIDEVRVYNRALSAAEIAQLYFCGNGVVDPGEECDDGNTNPSDGCTNACTVCGNGAITPPEQCDDGNSVNGDGCDANCTVTACGNGIRTGGEECDDGNESMCDGCLPTCENEPTGYRCGDGVVVSACGEECDDGNGDDSDGCTNGCTFCGNGVLTPPEECDDGNVSNDDACRNDCLRNVCGDGFCNPASEQCDDGNASNNDACRNDCRLNVCGDGFQNPATEQCDDGNRDESDGCTKGCTICGNGIVTTPEWCDDGNRVDTDACTADCRWAALVVGVGTPESCTEVALDAALAGSRAVTFNCGPAPLTITITSTKTIATDTTIDGGGSITISGGGKVRVFAVNSGVSFDARNLTVADGKAMVGGGVDNRGTATLTNCILSGNSAASGGGIANGGTLTLTNCTLSGNVASWLGGGIYNGGTLAVADCTLSGNSAGYGGGIGNEQGHLELTNSTLSGNSAGSGGGIMNLSSFFGCFHICACGSVVVTNSTLAGNRADTGEGGISTLCSHPSGDLAVSVANSVIAGSSRTNCGGGIIDGGHNLQWPGTSCGETIPSLDPLLDPTGLADNGGPTQTIALLPDSPAIDAGDPEACAGPPVNGVDQRGYARPGEGSVNCSIGAYEYDAADLLLCNGDCNGDGEITVDEIITGINIALGRVSVCACMPCDTDENGVISIAELIRAVHLALTGCPFWNGEGGDPQGSAAAWIESMRRQCEERAR
jgi:cysteine-rich repeat protein